MGAPIRVTAALVASATTASERVTSMRVDENAAGLADGSATSATFATEVGRPV